MSGAAENAIRLSGLGRDYGERPALEGVDLELVAAGGLPPLRTDQLQPVQIMDSAGFGQPMVAARISAPTPSATGSAAPTCSWIAVTAPVSEPPR